jgi:hypothetical protein
MVETEPAVKRGRGRPRMAVSAKLRSRNKRWLHLVAMKESTIREICEEEGVSRQTVARGIEDATGYHEMAAFVGWLRSDKTETACCHDAG